MLRVTVRALARKASSKVGSKAAAPVATSAAAAASMPSVQSIRSVPPVVESKVSIPPIPGVRSARAMRRQKRAAARLNVAIQQSKKQTTHNHANSVKPVKASSVIKKAASKARSTKTTVQHKVKKAVQASNPKPKKLTKNLSKKLPAKRTRM
ncbi:hypothetical protein ABL78_4361 [Leptomonas seymouri]|uniref:H1 histone-like protein n=1 Tax=Leptomonas seymouri TaxID=5684 RepID=A0A0N0P5K8_LEPSE|nr:hypothetical protein ABL78_4361 [Leptomonas seymouri]|eukprot:KPI86586.1 hypothetical protein ABL78_4361 [Leptomonas seymouri]